jgi:hypothetical protein
MTTHERENMLGEYLLRYMYNLIATTQKERAIALWEKNRCKRGKHPYKADTVAPKTVWKQWKNITCFASYSVTLWFLLVLEHRHRQCDTDGGHRHYSHPPAQSVRPETDKDVTSCFCLNKYHSIKFRNKHVFFLLRW